MRLSLKRLDGWRGFKSAILPMIFPAEDGAQGMARALEQMFEAAVAAIDDGANLLILSDRGVDATHAPIPSLLACAGLHHHLRTRGGHHPPAGPRAGGHGGDGVPGHPDP